MKPAPFAYHAPRDVDEACALLASGLEADEDVRVLAGGQSLVPMMNFRLAAPAALVDIGRIQALQFLRVNDTGELEVGAGIRQQELLRDRRVVDGWPVLAHAIRLIGHPQVRSRGTVCGSLAHHDPAGELPAAAVALDARLHLASVDGERDVPAAEFFVTHFEVALRPGELVVSVTFPGLERGTGWGLRELSRRRGDFAIVGACCILAARAASGDDPNRVVVFGAGPRPLRVGGAERLAAGTGDDFDVDYLRRHVAEAVEPASDIHASAEHRRALAAELVAQSLSDARERRE
jgi:carbon-monoxide dehydrogenase medium subunit